MTEYKAGRRVKVEFEGTVTAAGDDYLRVRQEGRPFSATGVTIAVEHATITLADPPDWPPQVGDIWEAEGQEYYVRQSVRKGGRVAVEPFASIAAGGLRFWNTDLLGEFKAHSPKLLRRRGQ
jgi:hypothetical protein